MRVLSAGAGRRRTRAREGEEENPRTRRVAVCRALFRVATSQRTSQRWNPCMKAFLACPTMDVTGMGFRPLAPGLLCWARVETSRPSQTELCKLQRFCGPVVSVLQQDHFPDYLTTDFSEVEYPEIHGMLPPADLWLFVPKSMC